MKDLLVSLFPIVLLIWLMTRKRSLPAFRALPIVAALFYLIQLIYFSAAPDLVHATVVQGLLVAWQPILIVWGAIFLFRTMEHSGAMDTMRQWLNSITSNKVAQLMIIGWAFSFMIEGASGFGTPAALAAPLLVGLGFKPVRVAILCLIMNSVPVPFAALGVPTWYGLSKVTPLLGSEELRLIAKNTVILHSVAALVIPLVALRFVVGSREIRRNLGFIYLSILGCIVPYLLIGLFAPGSLNYELPSIAGGIFGLVFSAVIARKGIGLHDDDHNENHQATTAPPPLVLAKSTFAIWGAVAVLIVTRAPWLGIGKWLKAPKLDGQLVLDSAAHVPLGSLGDFYVHPSLHLVLKNIMGTGGQWDHALLHIPSLIPFALVALICFALYRMSGPAMNRAFGQSVQQMHKPAIALMGALVFVKLLMMGGENSSATIIANAVANGLGSCWMFASAYLGALGAFFSGSNTVSNLTFGEIQNQIAGELGLPRTTILALQSVGGGMGNMVCIHNIVAVCSVLGLQNVEGRIIKSTVIPMVLYGIIVAIAGVLLL